VRFTDIVRALKTEHVTAKKRV